jgi:hypothetical protein
VALSILFLHSDFEYEWPEDPEYPRDYDSVFLILCGLVASCGLFSLAFAFRNPLALILSLVFFGATVFLNRYARCFRRYVYEHWVQKQRDIGREVTVWPFLRQTDFEQRLARPRLLAGVRSYRAN